MGYEDVRDAIQRLYPGLDLSTIVPPGSEDQAAEEEADPIPEDQTAAEEAIPGPVERATEGEAAPTSDPTPTRVGALVASGLFSVQEVDSDK